MPKKKKQQPIAGNLTEKLGCCEEKRKNGKKETEKKRERKRERKKERKPLFCHEKLRKNPNGSPFSPKMRTWPPSFENNVDDF